METLQVQMTTFIKFIICVIFGSTFTRSVPLRSTAIPHRHCHRHMMMKVNQCLVRFDQMYLRYTDINTTNDIRSQMVRLMCTYVFLKIHFHTNFRVFIKELKRCIMIFCIQSATIFKLEMLICVRKLTQSQTCKSQHHYYTNRSNKPESSMSITSTNQASLLTHTFKYQRSGSVC